MSPSSQAPLLRRLLGALLAALSFLAVALPSSEAHALGTVTIANRQPQESNGRWKLQMTINYGSKPHINFVPMVFVFTQVALYERALTDKSPDKPILNRIPLQSQTPINEDMDVGFGDGSGKVFPITKFDFLVRRDRGFEAGEYTLKIQLADGTPVGQVQQITLNGDNEVVDRRAIVFADNGKKKDVKKVEADKPASSDTPDPASSPPQAPEEPAAEAPAEAPPAPPKVPPKQGGCGCRVAPTDDAPGAAGLAGLALAGAIVARRRRAR